MSEGLHHTEDAAAYVLGALEPDEAAALERHIATCAECRDEVEALRETVEVMAAATLPVEVPRGVRRRLLAEVRRDARGSVTRANARPRRLALATALIVCVALVVVAFDGLAGSGSKARVVQASVGHASVRISDGQAELVVAHLAPAARGETYEVWLQRGASAPAASTLFDVSADGSTRVRVRGSLRGVRRVLVTAEPAGGTHVPTTSPLIVATLS